MNNKNLYKLQWATSEVEVEANCEKKGFVFAAFVNPAMSNERRRLGRKSLSSG
jgi:hypothetical protein